MSIHLSFVYRIRSQDIDKIYQSFALHYEQRLVMFARQAVSDVVQQFDPTIFWLNREKAALRIEDAVRREIKREGFVQVHSIQLLRAAFSPKYEQTIIGIQLATQSKTTSQYRQQVVRVLKEIDILGAETNATVTRIIADVNAKARILTNNASMEGFTNVQESKAQGYRMFYNKLGWRQSQLLKYMQIKTVQTHDPQQLLLGIHSSPQVN